MAYCDISHVAALNAARGDFDASTKPSATQVDLFIDQISGQIDAALVKQQYDVPITASSVPTGLSPTPALCLLQEANAVGAAYLVENSAQVGPKLSQFREMWNSALAAIKQIELPNVPRSSAQSLPRSGDETDFVFSRDMVL